MPTANPSPSPARSPGEYLSDADKVALLRQALAEVLPIAEQNGPAPFEVQEWARRVVNAQMAMTRTESRYDTLTQSLIAIASGGRLP